MTQKENQNAPQKDKKWIQTGIHHDLNTAPTDHTIINRAARVVARIGKRRRNQILILYARGASRHEIAETVGIGGRDLIDLLNSFSISKERQKLTAAEFRDIKTMIRRNDRSRFAAIAADSRRWQRLLQEPGVCWEWVRKGVAA